MAVVRRSPRKGSDTEASPPFLSKNQKDFAMSIRQKQPSYKEPSCHLASRKHCNPTTSDWC